MSKLAIIDGDALTYMSSKETIQESLLVIDEKINNILEKTEATHYLLFISNTPYFRHLISSDYKLSRSKYTSSLKWLKTLKKYLVEGWGAQGMDKVEADDLCAYWINQDLCIDGDSERIETRSTFESALMLCKEDGFPGFTFNSIEKVLCAVDKDLLQSIPGKHYNYTYKLEEKGNIDSLVKGWFIKTSIEDSINFRGKQLLMGDSTDGIAGLSGIGEAKAVKILKYWIEGTLESFILDYYIDYYKGDIPTAIFEFQKNYRLLHTLNCDQDFIREVGSIPLLQGVQEVPKKPDLIINQF